MERYHLSFKKTQPKAFIFENIKGLVDPRNKEAGYHANYYVVNSFDYGVPQNRVRIYIIGFKEEEFFQKFELPKAIKKRVKLSDVLGITLNEVASNKNIKNEKSMSLSSKNGFNDYFLFNDLRNGKTTIHTWDIITTTQRQKDICYLLLKNRRKSAYGKLDGNPLALEHFQSLDSSIKNKELEKLVELDIFKKVAYSYSIKNFNKLELSNDEQLLLSQKSDNKLLLDELKVNKILKLNKLPILKTIEKLKEKNILKVSEFRYEFKNTKISTGLLGVNRIFLPSSDTFPTLVASDTNDYITLKQIEPKCDDSYKEEFLKEVYTTKNYRKITKEEACLIQGFPKDFKLPTSRNRWMKLIGNSISVPVIDMLCKAILETGVFKVEYEMKEDFKELSA